VPAGFNVRIQHFHDKDALEKATVGTPEHPAKPPKYCTLAELYDTTGAVVAVSTAFCNPKDCPSRKKGRAIAHNRVIQTYTQFQKRLLSERPVLPAAEVLL